MKLRTTAVWLAALLTACTATLAPRFDAALVEGLTGTSTELLTFFASAAGGTDPTTYPARAATYDHLIGVLDALALQARARPAASARSATRANGALQRRGVALLSPDDMPSAVALEQMSATLAKMRDVDQQQGLTAMEVMAFRGQTVIYLDQAITYERYLLR